jgi:hypothetical protein
VLQPPPPPQPDTTSRRHRAPPTAPPVIAKNEPAPAVRNAAGRAIRSAPAPTPGQGDFSSDLEARRRARGAPAEDSAPSTTPVEDERARHNRIVAENLGLNRTPTYGPERKGGGIFQLERVGYTSAEFTFSAGTRTSTGGRSS